MPRQAGKMRVPLFLQGLDVKEDDWGMPNKQWQDQRDKPIRCMVKTPSGMSAARAMMTSGIPTYQTNWSVRMDARVASWLRIDHTRRFRMPGTGGVADRYLRIIGGPLQDSEDPTMVSFICKEVTADEN